MMLGGFSFTKRKMSSYLTIVSSTMPQKAVSTLRHRAEVVLLPPDPQLPEPVASHPDMLLFALEDTLVVHETYYSIAQTQIDHILSSTQMHLLLSHCPRGNLYPLDVGLNALVCGRYLLGRLDVLAPEVLALATEKGLTPVFVRQGYAGCNGLTIPHGTSSHSTAIRDDLLLTADPSLTRAATEWGIPVLPAPCADILLPGYDHGFIGGCGGVWQDQLFLCGTPSPAEWRYFTHPFLRGITITCLYGGALYDCGGIKCFATQ